MHKLLISCLVVLTSRSVSCMKLPSTNIVSRTQKDCVTLVISLLTIFHSNFDENASNIAMASTMKQSLKSTNVMTCHQRQLSLDGVIGSGGTGVVLKVADLTSKTPITPLVYKISRSSASQPSLLHECEVMRVLESKEVHHVPQCLDICAVDATTALNEILPSFQVSRDAVGILLSPYLPYNNAIISSDMSPEAARTAIQALVETVFEVIAAGFAVSDLQFLTDRDSGRLMLIDLSEAVEVDVHNPSFMDLRNVSNFIDEMCSSLSSTHRRWAREAMSRILDDDSFRSSVSSDVYEIISSKL